VRARESLKSHGRGLAICDSRRDRAANRLDHVTLTPGAAALAVATDTLWNQRKLCPAARMAALRRSPMSR
jgi:hypothetical protein